MALIAGNGEGHESPNSIHTVPSEPETQAQVSTGHHGPSGITSSFLPQLRNIQGSVWKQQQQQGPMRGAGWAQRSPGGARGRAESAPPPQAVNSAASQAHHLLPCSRLASSLLCKQSCLHPRCASQKPRQSLRSSPSLTPLPCMSQAVVICRKYILNHITPPEKPSAAPCSPRIKESG